MTNLWVLSANAKAIVRASEIAGISMAPVPRGEAHGHRLVVITTGGDVIPMAETTKQDLVSDIPTTLAAAIVEHSGTGGVIACMDYDDGDDLAEPLFDYYTWPRALKEAGHVSGASLRRGLADAAEGKVRRLDWLTKDDE